MDGRHSTRMTGVPSLEHLQDLVTSPALPHHYSVRSASKGIGDGSGVRVIAVYKNLDGVWRLNLQFIYVFYYVKSI